MLSRPKRGKTLALAIVCFVLSAGTVGGLAETLNPPTTPQPILVVRAHTDIPNQGAPTLDVLDLERYFTKTLVDHYVDKVVASSTTTMPRPPAPGTYLLDVSVDGMRTAERPRWVYNHSQYESVALFGADLSLSVKDINSGIVIEVLRSRVERRIDSSDELTEKRLAVYEAVDDLAGRFLDNWAAGHFGESLPASQAPNFLERAPKWLAANVIILALGAAICSLVVIVRCLRLIARLCTTRRPKLQPTPQLQPDYVAWDNETKAALALALKTDNFSEAACQAAARANRDGILASHTRIEAGEAERQLRAKPREAHFAELAQRAAATSGLEPNQVIDILRKADVWEYRVLQAAKKLALEVSK